MAMQKAHGKSFFNRLDRAITHNMHQIGMVVGLIFLFIGLALGYMFWMKEQNKAAQRYFGLLVVEYNQAKQEQDADWNALLKKFEHGYQKHSRSSLLPYYKDYAVNILLQQNKKEEALTVMDAIIADTQGSPLLLLYKTERALIALDMADEHIQKLAQDSLIALAEDKTNQFRDTAQFYLGRYYWAQNSIDNARRVWQQLVDEQYDQKAAPSPWVQQVKDYLSLVIA